jgi:uncharacterized protein (TIGR00730 family)
MTEPFRRICVFCGSSGGTRPSYRRAAVELGTLLAERGLGLVYGGSHLGLMGSVADTVLAAGGSVTGVMPRVLVDKEAAHRGLADLRVVDSMHERKALMASLADAFIALPGGYGTLEEFFEVVTWSQLGIHRKPCGLLNVDGYYDALLGLLDHAVGEGFLKPANRHLVIADDRPERLLQSLSAYLVPLVDKWIDRAEAKCESSSSPCWRCRWPRNPATRNWTPI